MSRQITQPITQVRLTNVAVVRMSRHGHRFEVACYRNKAVNFRQGIETDLSEVLQTDRVFSNVSKGEFAKSAHLQQAFATTDQDAICRTILLQGQLQVSDMERAAQYENTLREIASMVQEKCVNPKSNRPYTLAVIRQAMKEAEFKVHPTRGVKQQFLTCVDLLKKKGGILIERAKMHLCVHLTAQEGVEGVKLALREAGASLLPPSADALPSADASRIDMLIDPRLYRQIDSIVKDVTISGPHARLEIVRQCAIEQGDVGLQSELERREQVATVGETTDTNKATSAQEEVEDAMTKLSLENENVSSASSDLDEENAADQPTLNTSKKPRNQFNALLFDDSDNSDDDSDNDDDDDEDDAPVRPPSAAALAKSVMAQKAREQKQQQQQNQQREQAEGGKSKKKKKKRGKKNTQQHHHQEAVEEEESGSNLATNTTPLPTQTTTTTSTNPNPTTPTTPTPTTNNPNAKSCNTCGGAFDSAAEYRAHFRSDWHRYNLKLKMSGAAPVSLEEYQLCDGALLNELVSM